MVQIDGRAISKKFQCVALCFRKINREIVLVVEQFFMFQVFLLQFSTAKV